MLLKLHAFHRMLTMRLGFNGLSGIVNNSITCPVRGAYKIVPNKSDYQAMILNLSRNKIASVPFPVNIK